MEEIARQRGITSAADLADVACVVGKCFEDRLKTGIGKSPEGASCFSEGGLMQKL
jgi:hypothetical protein